MIQYNLSKLQNKLQNGRLQKYDADLLNNTDHTIVVAGLTLSLQAYYVFVLTNSHHSVRRHCDHEIL